MDENIKIKVLALLRRLAILQDPRYYSIVDDYNRLCSQQQSITEVNECALRPDICGDGKCIDTKEGYECECYPGFTRKPGGRCEDVDECLLGYCQGGICHNQPGSFTCDCPHGFVVSGDGRYCTGNRLLSSFSTKEQYTIRKFDLNLTYRTLRRTMSQLKKLTLQV